MIHPGTSFRGSAHLSRVRGVAFTQNHIYSLSGERMDRLDGSSNELRIWDPRSGEPLKTSLKTQSTPYMSISSSSPDESLLLISAPAKNRAVLWHVDALP